MNNDERKLHYKMYKSGKNWIIAGIVTLTMGISFSNVISENEVHADTQTSDVNSSNLSASSSSADRSNVSNSSSQAQSQSLSDNSSAASSNSSSSVALSSVSSASTSSFSDTDLTSSKSSDATLQSSNSSSSSASVSSSSATNNSSAISSVAASLISSNTKITSNASKLRGVAASDQKLIKKLAKKYKVHNIKKIQNKYYYVDSFGDPHKNVTVQLGKYVLEFNGSNGELTDNTRDWDYGRTIVNNDYANHNAFYNVDGNSITNVNGYLTADTWYRPKDILNNGTTWTPSTSNDSRPLLMSWWPSAEVQANYLNFMNSNGFGKTPSWHQASDGQKSLNKSSQEIQNAIERKITSSNGNTDWLHDLINKFIKTQSEWNMNSEEKGTDGLQGGQFLYVNNPLTSGADSNWRLTNRGPSNQDGKHLQETINSGGDFEFLLGNDIDNSNPVVQAEDLNWLHYVMNLGSILKNNPNGNFDGVRVDAIDDVDSDLIQLMDNYFKDAYKTDESDKSANNHLSILEDWDNWIDPFYMRDHGNPQLTMNPQLKNALQETLSPADSTQRSNLDFVINDGLADRHADWNAVDDVIPSYSFFRAHDNSVQGIVGQIIKDKFDKNVNADNPSADMDTFQKALKIYDADQWKTKKKYSLYNTPAAYALLLTNKALVPRVYYGDMYMEDGQFMAEKSPYYDSIDALLKARVKYVAGGQTSNVQTMEGDSSMTKAKNKYTGVLTSVRYGKNVWGPSNQIANNNSGIGIVISNNPYLKLSKTDKVVIDMGKSHANQAFRPLLNTTKSGLSVYNNDSDVQKSQIKYTNANGQLILDREDVRGYSNPQVSGYLSAWVPVGANANQDSRTTPSSTSKTQAADWNGKYPNSNLVANAALDSNVIYEGFSNFQAFPQTADQRENVVLAKNANLFKQWGITSFEFPPQYKSTVGNSFLDETFQNGYAFSDRYNFGNDGNVTKYGTSDDLINAIDSLHNNGIQAMADYVPDQVYDMPQKQLVAVQRVDHYAQQLTGTKITNRLYYSNTKGSGTDYQAKYGGIYLNELKQQYPDLFTTKQISTGKTIDDSQKITSWEAKYMNGTNIQGQGIDYILDNGVDGQYMIVNDSNNLPLQMLGNDSYTGFVKSGKNVNYYTFSGHKAINTFVKDDKDNYYYFDKNGNMVQGKQKINGSIFYFLSDGKMLINSVLRDSKGHQYFYGPNGGMYNSGFFSNPETGNERYFHKNGVMAKGRTLVNGQYQFFDTENGDQVTGEWMNGYYYDADTGNEAKSQFEDIHSKIYYFNNKGKAIKGLHVINGNEYYFDKKGVQIKGKIVTMKNGKKKYYSSGDGSLVKNSKVVYNGITYISNKNGILKKNS